MPSAGSSVALTKSAHTSRPLLQAVAEIWTTAAFLRDEMQDDTRSAAPRWAAGTVEEAMREDGEALLTVREAAAVSGASVGAVRRAVASGALAPASATGRGSGEVTCGAGRLRAAVRGPSRTQRMRRWMVESSWRLLMRPSLKGTTSKGVSG